MSTSAYRTDSRQELITALTNNVCCPDGFEQCQESKFCDTLTVKPQKFSFQTAKDFCDKFINLECDDLTRDITKSADVLLSQRCMGMGTTDHSRVVTFCKGVQLAKPSSPSSPSSPPSPPDENWSPNWLGDGAIATAVATALLYIKRFVKIIRQVGREAKKSGTAMDLRAKAHTAVNKEARALTDALTGTLANIKHFFKTSFSNTVQLAERKLKEVFALKQWWREDVPPARASLPASVTVEGITKETLSLEKVTNQLASTRRLGSNADLIKALAGRAIKEWFELSVEKRSTFIDAKVDHSPDRLPQKFIRHFVNKFVPIYRDISARRLLWEALTPGSGHFILAEGQAVGRVPDNELLEEANKISSEIANAPLETIKNQLVVDGYFAELKIDDPDLREYLARMAIEEWSQVDHYVQTFLIQQVLLNEDPEARSKVAIEHQLPAEFIAYFKSLAPPYIAISHLRANPAADTVITPKGKSPPSKPPRGSGGPGASGGGSVNGSIPSGGIPSVPPNTAPMIMTPLNAIMMGRGIMCNVAPPMASPMPWIIPPVPVFFVPVY